MTNIVELTSGAEFQLLDAGKYKGTVTEITQAMSQFDPSKPAKMRLTWDWELTDPDGGGPIPHKSWTSTSLHPNSTLTPLLSALGIDAGVGDFDLDECVGRSCFLIITQALKQDGQTMGNKTVGYAPLKKLTNAPAGITRETLQALSNELYDMGNDKDWKIPTDMTRGQARALHAEMTAALEAKNAELEASLASVGAV